MATTAASNLPSPPVRAGTYHRALHVLAVLLTLATFPLIFMGGLVTSHGAGMAVPDWPNSYGYNMFTFPPSQWVGGIWYEHVHRLKGTVVGFLAILLVLSAYAPAANPRRRARLGALAGAGAIAGVLLGGALVVLRSSEIISYEQGKFVEHFVVGFVSLALVLGAAWMFRRREPRAWVRWLCVVALVAVCVQGLMGGMRVTKVSLTLAIVHGCFAQAFFAMAACLAVVTSRWWIEGAANLSAGATGSRGRRIVTLGVVCLLALYAQLIVGATMRHHGAGLAIPDLPLAYGRVLPPLDPAGLDTINQYRAWTLQEKPVTLGQVWLHFGHRLGAIVVTALVLWLVAAAWRRSAEAKVRGPAAVIAALLVAQFTLGVLTVLWKKPADIASAHVAVGALLLMATAVLTTRAARLYSTRFRVAGEAAGFPVVVPVAQSPERPKLAAV